MTKKILYLCAFLCFAFNLSEIEAQTLNVQGMLRDADNRAVPNGEYDIRLELYDKKEGGSNLFWEDHKAKIVNGVYSLDLGSVRETEFRDLNFGKTYWLSVKVEGEQITERSRLSMSPYLFKPISGSNMIPSSGQAVFGSDIKTPHSWSILNGENNPIFKTGWTQRWGDYTSLSSGWGWDNDEPLTLVMSHRGLTFSKQMRDYNNYGRPLFRIDNSGRMMVGYGDDTFARNPRAFIDVRTNGKNRGIKAGAYIELNQTQANEPFYSINAHYEDGSLYNGSSRFKPQHAPGTGMILMSNAGQGHFRWFGTGWNNNSSPKKLSSFTQAFTITVDGRVGVNTHSPQANLDVRGDVAMLGMGTKQWGFRDQEVINGVVAPSDGFLVLRFGANFWNITIKVFYTPPGGSEMILGGWSINENTTYEDTFTVPVQKDGKWRIEYSYPRNSWVGSEDFGGITYMRMGR